LTFVQQGDVGLVFGAAKFNAIITLNMGMDDVKSKKNHKKVL
jgi:hypothetical protein